MQKFLKSQAKGAGNSGKISQCSFAENLDDIGFDDKTDNPKMKVECICPKCGRKHEMTFHWIGRGTPRKYCPACKGGHVE